MWRWRIYLMARTRGGRRLFSQQVRGFDQQESLSALKQLWKSALKVEVCQQTSTPGAKYSFLDLPDKLGTWWRVRPTGNYPSIRILSRSCYGPIFDEIYRHNTEGLKLVLERGFGGGMVLLGNPGIGKTGFLWYSLWKLLQKEEKVILKMPQVDHYYCFTWKDKEVVIEVAESGVEAVSIAGPQSWYLADRAVTEKDWLLHCKFLLTCSPLKANYSEFAKSGTVEMMYDPVWSLDELLALNEHNFGHPVEDVKARFHKWGGIPRYVLEKLDEASQMELVKAAGLVRDVNEIVKLESLPENQSHKAFHILVDERTYRSYGLDLASPYVKDIVYSNLPTGKLQQFIYCEQPESIRDIQGKLFKAFLIRRQIARGGMIAYRQLDETGEFGPVQGKLLPAMPKKIDLLRKGRGGAEAVFPEEIQEGDENALLVPSSLTNAEWDFIVHGSVYQVTVAPKRPLVLGDALENVLTFLRKYHKDKQLDFCFIVPRFMVSKFRIGWVDLDKKGGKEEEGGKAKGKEAVAKRKAEAAQRMKDLNINVKVVSFEIGDVCPRCKGEGVLDEHGPLNMIEKFVRF